ncbi:MAG: UDP-N-acetylmuramoyl-tripeptide--D-alanyl-D-alanine ligase [Cyclobacteriaceae bacterium]
MMENFIEYLYSKFLQSDGVSIDTRTISNGNLFFAIQGPNFNANKFASKALELGANFAVVDDPEYVLDDRYILAENGMKALQQLAIFHRSRFKRTVLGLTGSNGKTTTKEIINLVLQKKYITHATKGNYNNHLGVPLTLLHIHPQVEIAIIEMGANHVGDIAELCSYANPNYGLITNIGEAHTETFGGIEGVLRGKSELFDHLRKTNGTPLINTSDPRLMNMTKRFEDPITYPNCDLKLVSADPYLTISIGDRQVKTSLIGAYNFPNIAAAVAVGRTFGVEDTDILDAIASYVPSNQRSQVLDCGEVQVILDCYNANPTSMRAALENLGDMHGKKHVVLGDMKEVEDSLNKHKEVGELVKSIGVESAIFIGDNMSLAAQEVPGSYWYENVDQAIEALKSQPIQKGNVLVKGSRSMRLEQLSEQIFEQNESK